MFILKIRVLLIVYTVVQRSVGINRVVLLTVYCCTVGQDKSQTLYIQCRFKQLLVWRFVVMCTVQGLAAGTSGMGDVLGSLLLGPAGAVG